MPQRLWIVEAGCAGRAPVPCAARALGAGHHRARPEARVRVQPRGPLLRLLARQDRALAPAGARGPPGIATEEAARAHGNNWICICFGTCLRVGVGARSRRWASAWCRSPTGSGSASLCARSAQRGSVWNTLRRYGPEKTLRRMHIPVVGNAPNPAEGST